MVSNYLSTALHSAEAAVMVSCLANLHSVQLLLENCGIDVEKATRSGSLIMLDGYSFISQLTEGDIIQPEVFDRLFVRSINGLLEKFPQVCFYGDLVSGMIIDGFESETPLLGDLAIELEMKLHEFQASTPNLVGVRCRLVNWS
jgi:hypothetical protein